MDEPDALALTEVPSILTPILARLAPEVEPLNVILNEFKSNSVFLSHLG